MDFLHGSKFWFFFHGKFALYLRCSNMLWKLMKVKSWNLQKFEKILWVKLDGFFCMGRNFGFFFHGKFALHLRCSNMLLSAPHTGCIFWCIFYCKFSLNFYCIFFQKMTVSSLRDWLWVLPGSTSKHFSN